LLLIKQSNIKNIILVDIILIYYRDLGQIYNNMGIALLGA